MPDPCEGVPRKPVVSGNKPAHRTPPYPVPGAPVPEGWNFYAFGATNLK
jgi:hypothetical protein